MSSLDSSSHRGSVLATGWSMSAPVVIGAAAVIVVVVARRAEL